MLHEARFPRAAGKSYVGASRATNPTNRKLMRTDPLSKETILDALQALVSTPSVNPHLAVDEPSGESAVAQVACRWLTERGVKAWTEEVAPDRPNAVAEVGDGAGPTLVLCAHLD